MKSADDKHIELTTKLKEITNTKTKAMNPREQKTDGHLPLIPYPGLRLFTGIHDPLLPFFLTIFIHSTFHDPISHRFRDPLLSFNNRPSKICARLSRFKTYPYSMNKVQYIFEGFIISLFNWLGIPDVPFAGPLPPHLI